MVKTLTHINTTSLALRTGCILFTIITPASLHLPPLLLHLWCTTHYCTCSKSNAHQDKRDLKQATGIWFLCFYKLMLLFSKKEYHVNYYYRLFNNKIKPPNLQFYNISLQLAFPLLYDQLFFTQHQLIYIFKSLWFTCITDKKTTDLRNTWLELLQDDLPKLRPRTLLCLPAVGKT